MSSLAKWVIFLELGWAGRLGKEEGGGQERLSLLTRRKADLRALFHYYLNKHDHMLELLCTCLATYGEIVYELKVHLIFLDTLNLCFYC